MDTTITLQNIIKSNTQNSFSYDDYMALLETLVAHKDTSGNQKDEDLVNYTALNLKRMQRWNKVGKLNDQAIAAIQNISEPQEWIVITESWCGDAAHTVPFINKLAQLNDNISLKIVLKDENETLMNEFLTNGGQAIPKLIVTDKNHQYISDWGPRPSNATQLVNDFKNQHGKLTAEFKTDLQKWYNKDKGADVLHDVIQLISK